ncbi:transcriptional regulator [Kitasatospora herbaricolor]|uniref:ROK family transcriptional regulator n=1 Tax=Kitasatospora herbaricolor TaxID=68217 RepID=UPI0017481630|nr:ROK family transcriptional regulator [Kitasatospora herbaricolor]GGV38190.1 transcriptional regulator [Kitasatospora herbaricolor]
MAGPAAARGPHVLRRINGEAVLSALRAAELDACRVSDLSAVTGLSRPAVTRALADLCETGLVEDIAADPADEQDGRPLGRPARLARFRSEAGHVCGVDIGPHKVLVIVADLKGRAVASYRTAVPPHTRGADLVVIAEWAVAEALKRARLSDSDLWAVCVGTPGIVDRGSGTVLKAPSIPGWAGLSIIPELAERFGCPVLLENDVTLAVLAELAAGDSNEGGESLVLVQWGQRIGTGIVIDGKPYRGASAAAGELGFIDLDPAGHGGVEALSDAPDGMGAFERLVGASTFQQVALAAYASAAVEAPSGLETDEEGLAVLFAAAKCGDPIATAVVDKVAGLFARGLALLLLLLDPGRVVIGGGLSIAGETLLGPVRRHLENQLLVPTEVVASELGERGVALGAVRAALDAVEPRIALSERA